ncbi:deuterolysin metalloprotease [Pestalotiopsis sp. NC0098]|nr:deuterolysin metalloprotease [Pestalotiopsis sp. NC0098]
MYFSASLLSMVAVASAASVNLGRRATSLDVKLEMTGNTAVKAIISNNGADVLKIFKTGTLLADIPTEKINVFQADSKVDFEGIRLRVSTAALDEDAFQTIRAGEVVEKDFDIAHMHDLSTGGAFDIVASGAMSFAHANSTELEGTVPLSSNTLSIQVDGTEAEAARSSFLERRTAVQSDCTSTKKTTITTAIGNCASWATKARTAATAGTKLTEYFKSSSSSVVSTVSGVFQKMASECGSTTSGNSKTYCSDVYGACSSGVLAYTLPSGSYIAYCNLFFTALSPVTSTCHAQDQAGTVVHETTHLSQIKGTQDYGVYGYSAVQSLSAAQNLNHADTYALYAQGKYSTLISLVSFVR